MKFATLWIVVLVIGLQACKIVDPYVPTAKPATLILVPDSTYGTSLNWTPFEVKWSDSTKSAERYLWDFGDGTSASSTRSTQSSHFYNAEGTYRVNVMAFNSNDSVISVAHGVAIIGSATFEVRLDSAHYTVTSDGRTVFHATLDPKIAATYEWTIDGVVPTTSYATDSLVSTFDESGHHVLRVSAIAYGRVVARDSAEIDVILPSTSIDELASFGSLDILAISNSDTLRTTFSLLGGPGNSYSHVGPSFVVTSNHQLHLDLGAGRALDTAGNRRAAWELTKQRYLDSARVTIQDSKRIGSKDTALLTNFHASFGVARLTLISRSANDVIFEGHRFVDYSQGTDTTHIVPPSGSGTGCPDPISVGFRTSLGYVRFTFRPAR